MSEYRKRKMSFFHVFALKRPGPKWHKVADSVRREAAVKEVAREWSDRNMARVIGPDQGGERQGLLLKFPRRKPR